MSTPRRRARPATATRPIRVKVGEAGNDTLIAGAMGGGILLGLFEGVGPLLILGGLGIPGVSQLKDAVAFVALVLVLVFRPSGLFGERLGSEDRV